MEGEITRGPGHLGNRHLALSGAGLGDSSGLQKGKRRREGHEQEVLTESHAANLSVAHRRSGSWTFLTSRRCLCSSDSYSEGRTKQVTGSGPTALRNGETDFPTSSMNLLLLAMGKAWIRGTNVESSLSPVLVENSNG